jgi:hypothetical protein
MSLASATVEEMPLTIGWNRLGLALFVLLLSAGWPGLRPAEAANDTIVSRTAQIEGVAVHYLTAGQGAPLILLHGYTQTSRMWRPIMPRLAEQFMEKTGWRAPRISKPARRCGASCPPVLGTREATPSSSIQTSRILPATGRAPYSR